MINKEYTKLLQDVSNNDLPLVGGKAANLGEMINAGLPVPQGFVITCNSYNEFIAFNDIDIKINKLFTNLNGSNPKDVKIFANAVKDLFYEGYIPVDILYEINERYEKIENGVVAVRSSATLEDSPEASFAGLHDSYLNVKGQQQLHKYIKKCWASLWNFRALSYRLKHKYSSENLSHSVIVQKLIRAEKSGVMFTANPINNRRDQIVINASWGLGEALVSGEVTPDQWILDKNSKVIVEENIAIKEKMTITEDDRTVIADVCKKKQNTPTLNNKELVELYNLGESAENHFRVPQDIEWAFYNRKFYLTQSRPVTTLFPKLKPVSKSKELRIYINFLLVDKVMPEPLTPIGEDIWKEFLKSILPKLWIKSAAGRLFVDTTELSRIEKWWQLLEENPSAMDPLTVKTLVEILKRDKVELKQQRKPLISLVPTFFGAMRLSFVKFLLASMPKAIYGMLATPENAVKKAFEYSDKEIRALEVKASATCTVEQKIEFIEQNTTEIFYFIPLKILYYVIRSFTYLEKVRKILSKYSGDLAILSKVEKSLPNNVTTEMNMQLIKIARQLDQSGEKPSLNHPSIKKFLSEYGHRAYLEVDPGVVRWKENPDYILSIIQSHVDNKDYNQSIQKFNQGKEEAKKAINGIYRDLKSKNVIKDAKKIRKLLTKYRKLFGVRELPKYTMSKGVSIFRETLLEIGQELVVNGRLNAKEDVCFVSLKDIKDDRNLKRLVLENKKLYYKELKRVNVPRVITSKGETIYSPYSSDKDNLLIGIPVSSGVYEGLARVLRSPEEGVKLKKGDILVTKATNPVWTPLFLKISGLITEMGGPMSHGSVVAREYGIPSVAGIKNATTQIIDGQSIRLNGETGEVEILQS